MFFGFVAKYYVSERKEGTVRHPATTWLLVVALAGAACGGSTETAASTVSSSSAPTRAAPPPPTAPNVTTTVTTAATTTTIAPSPVTWTPLADGPVHEDRRRYGNPGVIIVEDGTWHMFANAFDVWPGEVVVRHLTSTDGLTWEEATPVLLSFKDSPIQAIAAMALGGFHAPDGTWSLYFHTFDGNDRPGVIGRATAIDPDGPWTIDPDPVLTPGEPGTWDEFRVIRPSVVVVGDEVWMYYAGFDESGRAAIGLAISTDGGSTWTKWDDPATTEPRLAAGDPILQGVEAWEAELLERPEVVIFDDRFVMLYQGGTGGPLGVATSADGHNWTRPFDGPVFRPQVEAPSSFYQGELVAGPDGLVFYLEAGSGGGTDLYGWSLELPGA